MIRIGKALSAAERSALSPQLSLSRLPSSHGGRGTPSMLRVIPDRAEHRDRRRWTGPRRQPKVLLGQPPERRDEGQGRRAQPSRCWPPAAIASRLSSALDRAKELPTALRRWNIAYPWSIVAQSPE